MEKARQQAQSYARNLPPDELKDGGRPVTPDEVAPTFDAAPVVRVSEWLAALGPARVGDDGRCVTA
jgi:hypothetical protein